MNIRPYMPADFAVLRQWISDARTHALWCANRFPYPPEAEGFAAALQEISARTGDRPYIAADETGRAVGFFCRSLNPETNECMLKFVIVDGTLRGRGVGTEMLRLAVRAAFAETDAGAVQLMVFSENPAAIRCYRKTGFQVRTCTPDAFRFGAETWDRCNMVIRRTDTETKE